MVIPDGFWQGYQMRWGGVNIKCIIYTQYYKCIIYTIIIVDTGELWGWTRMLTLCALRSSVRLEQAVFG